MIGVEMRDEDQANIRWLQPKRAQLAHHRQLRANEERRHAAVERRGDGRGGVENTWVVAGIPEQPATPGMLEQRDERVALDLRVTPTGERVIFPREAVAGIEHVTAQPGRGVQFWFHARVQAR